MKIETNNPATEQNITSYDLMDREAAFSMVDASHKAFLQWRTTTHQERASQLVKIASALRSQANEIARLMSTETGKLLRDSKSEVELCAKIFEYTAENGPKSWPMKSEPIAAVRSELSSAIHLSASSTAFSRGTFRSISRPECLPQI